MNSKIQIINRRDFLSYSTKFAALTALTTLTDIPFVVKRALAEGTIGLPGSNGRPKKILFIFLRGANDGLNSLAPIQDPAYATSRKTIALKKGDATWKYDTSGEAAWAPSGNDPTYSDFALPVGNAFAALHPALKFLAPVYNTGNLALIHRVGYPKQSRSHFDSQAYWETGMPRVDNLKEGIFYRAMVESGLAQTSALTGVSIQSSLPVLLRGSKVAMTNISDPTRYNLLAIPSNTGTNAERDAILKAKKALNEANEVAFADKHYRDFLQLQYKNLTSTLDIFAQINFGEEGNTFQDNEVTDGDSTWANLNGGKGYYLFPTTNEKNGGWVRSYRNEGAQRVVDQTSANKYVVPTNSYDYFRNLKAAAMVLNNTDALVAGTQIDGWDTHSNQGGATGSHANLLKRVGWSVYALQKYFSQYSNKVKWEDVMVVTLSEFGRTTIENDDNGTDHAEASVMWVAGGAVKGFRKDGLGNVQRSGVFNCGPSDPLPWNVGPTGTMFGVEKRYLQRATDYRSVLGKMIRDHLGATQDQLDRIVPGYGIAGEKLKSGGVQSRDNTPITAEPDFV